MNVQRGQNRKEKIERGKGEESKEGRRETTTHSS